MYNEANEKIGDINEVILDRSGKVANVILGVGGFLGLGEHYVAVAFDKLKWVDQPVTSTTASTTSAPANAPATTSARDALRSANTNRASAGRRPSVVLLGQNLIRRHQVFGWSFRVRFQPTPRAITLPPSSPVTSKSTIVSL